MRAIRWLTIQKVDTTHLTYFHIKKKRIVCHISDFLLLAEIYQYAETPPMAME